jgi:sec-independent protein translocase protein TatA
MPGPEWIWVVIVIAVIFGASRLPAMGRNFGLGIKEFKKGITEASRDDDKAEDKPEARHQAGEERGPSR